MPGLSGAPGARSITVLVVDTVDSTALGARLGHERVEQLMADELVRLANVVEQHEGFVLRTLGDGIMAGFQSSVAALDAAAEMHRAVAFLNDEQRLHTPLDIRIAVAASDVVLIDDDIRGAAPIYAARTEKLVPNGQTWCTETVRLLARGRGVHEFDSVGAHLFKGLDEHVQLHRVRVPMADMLGMPTTLDSTRRFEFVGRQDEARHLETAWNRAVAGSGSLVVIAGEPGVGKTRLCREFALTVRQRGAIVLHGRCSEAAGEAYAPFTQILRTMLARVVDAPSAMGAGVAELARILPEIREVVPDLAAPSDVDANTDRFRLFEAVGSWLSALSARTPVLLVIDDLSWADEPSVQMLRHVAEHVGTEHMLVVASYRPADSHAPARTFLRQHGHLVDRLALRGLTQDEVVTFVEALLDDRLDASGRTTAVRIGDHVGGNPLYLGEIIPSLVEEHVLERDPVTGWTAASPLAVFRVPPAVGDLIRSRVEHLSLECQQVLRTAAVMGFEFSPELLLDLVELPPMAVVEALDESDLSDLTHSQGGSLTYEFTHAVIRQAVYDGISSARRATEHRRVGEAIEKLFARDLDGWLEALAYHFENGLGWQDSAKAITYLRQAGQAAVARLAHDHAVEFYQRARLIVERSAGRVDDELKCDILIELGTAQRRSGSDAAPRTLMNAADLAVEIGDARRATSAVLGLGRGTFAIAGAIDVDRVAAIQRTLELTGPAPTAQRARLLATLSAELAFDDSPDTAQVASDEALAIARELGDMGLLVTVLGNRLVALWRADRVDERLVHAAELEAICRLAGDNRRGKFLSAMTVCAQVAMEAGDFDTADRLLHWLDETAQTLHQPTSVAYAKLRLASRACLAGRLGEAEQLADEAYLLCAQAGQPDAEVFHTGQLFTIRLHQGRTAEVIDPMAEAAKSFPGVVAFAAGEATCAGEIGDYERCRAVIDPVVHQIDELRHDLNWLTTIALATNAVHHLGDRQAAASLRPLIAPYRRLFVDNASAFFGSAHHYYALLSAVLGDDPEADAAFEAAIEAHTRLRSPPWLARTHLEYASTLAARSGPARGPQHEHAMHALALGKRWGLNRIVERAERLLGDDHAEHPQGPLAR